MSVNTPVREKSPKTSVKILILIVTLALWIVMAVFLFGMLFHTTEGFSVANVKTNLTADFENMMTKKMGDIVEIDCGDVVFASTKREYTLSDQDLVAPSPNRDLYVTVDSPMEVAPVLEEAMDWFEIPETLFTTETEIIEGTKIRYYMDDTIFVVVWKQAIGNCVYTFSEVQLADASQFRRFLADGKYGASAEYTTQEMATSVNAVMASSADYYGYRGTGVCVNEGIVYRSDARLLDTCFIDENGDLLFARREEFSGAEDIQRYVDENNVRFSLSFGPIMIEDGEYAVPSYYHVGEIHDEYSRAALCQMGPLHYVIVASNYEGNYQTVHTMGEFTRNLMALGITRAYALDGGQTATIVMNNEVINRVSYGAQRNISDIIYFATAIPEDEWN